MKETNSHGKNCRVSHQEAHSLFFQIFVPPYGGGMETNYEEKDRIFIPSNDNCRDCRRFPYISLTAKKREGDRERGYKGKTCDFLLSHLYHRTEYNGSDSGAKGGQPYGFFSRVTP